MKPKQLLLVVALGSTPVLAQDVEQLYSQTKQTIKENPYDVKGAIGASATFYDSKGIPARRDPFYWVLNANLNFTLLNKIHVPFTAVFTQQDARYSQGLDKYSQPFNQFGISPSYRWLTVHAGYRTLNFSEYSLSGAMFLGGGIEVKPAKQNWSTIGFFGRFMKAVPQQGLDGVTVGIPAYQRFGGGAKLRAGNANQFVDFVFLKIKDEPNSIPFDTALTITPQENQVLSLALKQKLGERFSIDGEFAYSMFTKNLYEDPYVLQAFNYVNQIYTPRPSSKFNKAFNGVLNYTEGPFTMGLAYKRIDPDYQTLGAIFMTNDIEEISVNATSSFLNNKVSVNGAVGLQKNNLDKIQALTSRRVISSIGLNFNPVESYNVNGTYSNFSSNTLPVRDVFTDTIRFVQLTQNGGLTQTLGLGKKSLRHIIMNVITYQESKATSQGLTTFLSENFTYQVQLSKTGLSISTSIVYNKTDNELYGSNVGLGPQFRLQKSFIRNRASLMISAGAQEMRTNEQHEGRVLTTSIGIQYKIDKKQNLRMDGLYTDRQALKKGALAFSETRGTISYSYNFGIKKKTKT